MENSQTKAAMQKSLTPWPHNGALTLPLREVAKYLHVHYNTIHRWISAGKIEYIRLGHRSIHFTYDQIQDFLSENRKRNQLGGAYGQFN